MTPAFARRMLLIAAGLLAVLATGTLPPASAPAQAATLPAGLVDKAVLQGLNQPTAVRFAPDGRIFVAEKAGIIKVFTSLTDTAPRVVANLSTQVHDYADRGLLAIALGPDFATRPAVYALYTRDAEPGGTAPRWDDGCPTPPGPETDGCVVGGRLSRIALSGDTGTGEQVLLDAWCQQFPSHSVGALAFDSSGALIVSAGDGASFNGVDYGQFGGTYAGDKANPCADPPGGAGTALTAPTAEGGALRSQSMGRLTGGAVLNGSILRLNPATGAAAADNPNAGSADPNRARVIAYGMRNPYRFAIRPGTDELWLGDVGWNASEEINRIGSTRDGTVENFGWPCYEGAGPQPGYQGAGLSACQRLYQSAGAVTAPYLAYAHSAAVAPNDGCPTGGSSVSGVAFNTGSKYPASYDGAMFFADYGRNCIWAMAKGANGAPDPTAVSPVVSDAAGPVDLQIGPDGLLYYVGIFDGSIHRIEPGTSDAPTSVYVSALTWTASTNGWGPVERDQNGGGLGTGDGGPLMIDSTLYRRGLGTHAVSSVTVTVPSGCTRFDAQVGLDDSAGANGSVVYRVLLDGQQAFASPRVTGSSAAVPVSVPVTGGASMELRVDDGGDGIDHDHADWGDAKLTCGSGTPPPPPPPPPGGNASPTTTITSPTAPLSWRVGQEVSFAGSGRDPETGALPASALTWQLIHHHCPDTCHTHFVREWKGVASGTFTTGDIDYPGWYELTLKAVDDQGAAGASSVKLEPKVVNLTFQTNPRGLKLAGLVVGSGSGTTPFTRTVIVGSANTVSAPSPQTVKSKVYRFVSWSDGGAQNHTIVAPAVATTYTANYRQ